MAVSHREDRWVKERFLCQALVTTLEKSGVLTLALKLSAEARHYLIHSTFIHSFIHSFIAWTIFLVTWGVTSYCCHEMYPYSNTTIVSPWEFSHVEIVSSVPHTSVMHCTDQSPLGEVISRHDRRCSLLHIGMWSPTLQKKLHIQLFRCSVPSLT